MYFYDAIRQICAMADDPNLDSLKTRAIDWFFQVVNSKLLSASPQDIPGYYKVKSDVDVSSGYAELGDVFIGHLLGVSVAVNSSGANIDTKVKVIERGDVPWVQNNKWNKPGINELYVYMDGTKLRIIENPNGIFTKASDKLTINYIQYVDPTNYSATASSETILDDVSVTTVSSGDLTINKAYIFTTAPGGSADFSNCLDVKIPILGVTYLANATATPTYDSGVLTPTPLFSRVFIEMVIKEAGQGLLSEDRL